MPKLSTIWKVATWVVTPGTSVATRNRATTSFRKRKVKRSIAYAAIEPMMTVPVMAKSRMNAVFPNAASIWPSWNAVT